MPREIEAKSILNISKTRDPWFLDDYTINPYSGCSFNCLFCFIRGRWYAQDMSEKLGIKTNAAELLDKQLYARAKKRKFGIIVMSSATEPYLQFEKETKLTRSLLEIILKHKFPVHIVTRSNLVERDFDLLEQIESKAILPHNLRQKLSRKVFITFSFSTLDDKVAKIFEPGATPPTQRLATHINALKAGFHSGISMMPMIPYVLDTDENLNTLFQTFTEAGSKYVFPAQVTLAGDAKASNRVLVRRAVKEHFPEHSERFNRMFIYTQRVPAYYKYQFNEKITALFKQYPLKDRI